MTLVLLLRAAVLAAVISSGVSTAAWAATPDTAPPVLDVLKNTTGAIGVFVSTEDGSIRHVQSGMVCPAVFPNLNLWHLKVYVAGGSDVGCDYGRNGPEGRWTSKLTLYAVKAGPSDTSESAFTRYRSDLLAVYPNARALGPALTVENVTSEGDTFPGMETMRSEEYEIVMEGRRLLGTLIVATKAGWIVKVRASTFTDVSSDSEAAKATSDLAAPGLALFQALGSVDGGQAEP